MKEADTIKLLAFPNVSQFRGWKVATRNEVNAASGRPGKSVYRWIMAVEKQSVTWGQLGDPGKYPTLDNKLLSAILKVQSGPLGTRILMACEAEALAGGRPLAGRQALRMIYDDHRVDLEAGILHTIEDLTAAQLNPDNIERFITAWDLVVAGQQEPQPEQTLKTLFLRQVRKAKALEHDVAYYDRLPVGHPDRCYQFMHNRVRVHIERAKAERNREQQCQHLAGKSSTALAATDQSRGKKKEKGKGGRSKSNDKRGKGQDPAGDGGKGGQALLPVAGKGQVRQRQELPVQTRPEAPWH